MHIYLFGSICRGEIDEFSDIDLLAIVNSKEKNQLKLDTEKFSIYEEKRLRGLWNEGNPFAWHLHLESKLVYSSNAGDPIRVWGEPRPYSNVNDDLKKFHTLFSDSLTSILESEYSRVFDLSMLFLAIRNFASCYSLGHLKEHNFSRNSALKLTSKRLEISEKCFQILERSRILSTRGKGAQITNLEINIVLAEIHKISDWFQLILENNE
ncbi:MAG: nucleotidyltransferase domain-containing protein [Roseivirga sp.]